MIKDIISEKEKHDLAMDGFVLEYKENMLIIRDYLGEPIVEIFYFEVGKDILISSREKYCWVKKIKAIISAFGNTLCIAWGEKDSDAIIV